MIAVPMVGNARFYVWERPFPLMGTGVSTHGNARFRLWEQELLHMETGVTSLEAELS